MSFWRSQFTPVNQLILGGFLLLLCGFTWSPSIGLQPRLTDVSRLALGVGAVMMIGSGAWRWIASRPGRRRTAKLARGCCPGCGQTLSGCVAGSCPGCGEPLTEADFNAAWSGYACREFAAVLSGMPPARQREALSLLQGRCPGCGFALAGLPDPVCPECGRQFGPDDVDLVWRGYRALGGTAGRPHQN